MVTARVNYSQDLLCIYVLTLLESENNTTIKGPLSMYIIMPQIKCSTFPTFLKMLSLPKVWYTSRRVLLILKIKEMTFQAVLFP